MTTLSTPVQSILDYWHHLFESRSSRRSHEPQFIKELRTGAIEKASSKGFPTIKDESWKYTSVRKITETVFSDNYDVDIPITLLKPYLPDDKDCTAFSCLNGRFSPQLSNVDNLQDGVTLLSLADAISQKPDILEKYLNQLMLPEENIFALLNTALFESGVVLHISKGTKVSHPVYISFFSSGVGPIALFPRCLVVLEEEAEISLVETIATIGESSDLISPFIELYVDENARVDYTRIQLGNESSFLVSTNQIEQLSHSRCTLNTITMGGGLVRNQTGLRVAGEYAEGTLNGLYALRNKQHTDNHTTIDHAKANCNTFELYKGILEDQSTAAFCGRIIVRPDSQKTDSKQSNMNLLLSPEAVINSRPQLEIFADDVRCTHGATIGRLDEDALFYLRTRGLSYEQSKHLLTYAFASDVIEHVNVPSVRERLERSLFERLAE